MRHDKRIDMTSMEFGWTAISILLLGVLTGWGLFSTPQLGRSLVLNSGSLAEWLAAGGTWVIGFGAWKYARASHEHHVRAALAAELRDQKVALTGLASMIAFLARLQGPVILFKQIDAKTVDWTVRLPTVLKATCEVLRPLRWDTPERQLLSDAALKEFVLGEIECQRYLSIASDVLSTLSTKKLSPTEATKLADQFRSFAGNISNRANPVTEFAKSERQRLGKSIRGLKARLRDEAIL